MYMMSCPWVCLFVPHVMYVISSYLLLGMPWLYDNHAIYDGHANTYSHKHNWCNLTLTSLPRPQPHNIELGKGSMKSLHNSETWDKCATSKSKCSIALVIVKPNTNEKANPLCHMTLAPSHGNGDAFMHRFTIGSSEVSKPYLGVKWTW